MSLFPNAILSFKSEYRFLSNFALSTIEHKGVRYPTVEHAFQAMKTRDESVRARIAALATPAEAKRAGQRVALREDWEEAKYNIMLYLTRRKFHEHPDLAQKLLATEKAFLVEGNTWNDTYWGVCNGIGLNRLGQILMQVREELSLTCPQTHSIPEFD